MRPFTDEEWETLPHIVMTDDSDWDPPVYDHNPLDDDTWHGTVQEVEPGGSYDLIHLFGEIKKKVNVQHATFLPHSANRVVAQAGQSDAMLMFQVFSTKSEIPDLAPSSGTIVKAPSYLGVPLRDKSEMNPADILSKHWSYSAVRPQLEALMFWQGGTCGIGES